MSTDKLQAWATDVLRKGSGRLPPHGFTPIPGSKHGGFHKKTGAGYSTWYPGESTSRVHEKGPGGTTTHETAHGHYEIAPGSKPGKHTVSFTEKGKGGKTSTVGNIDHHEATRLVHHHATQGHDMGDDGKPSALDHHHEEMKYRDSEDDD